MEKTELFNKIKETLAQKNGVVQVTTYLRSTVYKHKHADMFRQGKSGSIYVQRGRNWDCIDYCKIRFGYMKKS
jgi:hypothetical protein